MPVNKNELTQEMIMKAMQCKDKKCKRRNKNEQK